MFKGMNAFESWQVVNMTIQTILLLATFLGALYIGLKQNELNQQLVELQYQPSIEVSVVDDQLQILNKGNHNVWLWGNEIEGNKAIEKEPRLIPPQGFYYIPLEQLKARVLQNVGKNGEARLNVTTFISTIGDRNYLVRNIFYCVVKESLVTIHSQTIGISKTNEPFLSDN